MRRVLRLALVSLALIAISAAFWFRARETPDSAPAIESPNTRVTTTPAATVDLERSDESADTQIERIVTPASAKHDAERPALRASSAAPVERHGLTVTGQVRSPAGVLLSGASVRARQTRTGRGFAGTTSRSDGTFTLAGLTVGEYVLEARAKDYVPREFGPFVVTEASSPQGVDVVLAPEAVIAGRLLEEGGAPAAGVYVYAMPLRREADETDSSPDWRAGALSIVTAVTQTDGSFTLALQVAERHWLWTEVGRFSGWRSWLTDTRDFAADTKGIELRVRRARAVRVLVADALTRAPIRAFSLHELESEVPWRVARTFAPDPLEPAWRPDSVLQREGGLRLLLDDPPQRVRVMAEGYATRVLALSTEPEQTVLLEPLGGLRGSVRLRGAPFKSVEIIVRSHRSADRTEGDLPLHPGAERRVEVSTGATFLVDEIAPYSYDVFAKIDGRRAIEVLRTDVTVAPGRVTDLGELDVATGASSVRLKLVLPAGATADEYWRALDIQLNGSSLERPRPVAGSTSVFGYDELPAGRFEIVFARSSPLLGEPQRWFATLTPSDTRELTLDLGNVPLCRVTVTLAADSTRAVSDHVCVRSEDGEARARVSLRWLFEQRPHGPVLARGSTRVVVDACDAQHHPLSSSGPIELPRTGRREIVLFAP